MATAANRRSPRILASLDVILQTVDGDVPFQTHDASYEGVFIVSKEPLPLRKLIRFRTRLPTTGEELQMLGLVAHTVSAGDAYESGKTPGMGIQLFSLGKDTARRWRDFIDEAYEANPEARAQVERSRRPAVRVRIPTPSVLQKFREVDLARGQLFLRTPDLHPAGTRVDCLVSHPTSGQTLTIDARVDEVVDGSIRERGLRLSLTLPHDTTELDRFFAGQNTSN